ncbi:tail fiber protein [Pseudomonas mendocina]|nr:tail fiber protein [Pseudomonas mendocina]MBH3339814.1 tail fiber protein [Pseudomonas mendocina]
MEPFLGEIKMVGFNFAPRGYAMCQGQLMSIAQNSALFSLLGTLYGGNGQSTFGLPDYRGRGPVGMGQGPGLSMIVQGEVAGTESVTLLNTNLPPFSLPVTGTVSVAIPASTADGSSQVPGTSSVLAKPLDSAAGAEVSLYGSAPDTTLAPFNANLNASAVHSSGGIPLGTRNPYLGTNFIIALEGVFPSRN